MQTLRVMISALCAWVLAVIYDQIRINTGLDLKLLLCASVITMAVGLYLFCRKPKETNKGEV